MATSNLGRLTLSVRAAESHLRDMDRELSAIEVKRQEAIERVRKARYNLHNAQLFEMIERQRHGD